MDVVTMGEALASLAAPEVGRLEHVRTLTKSFGGAESNTAIGLARLGHQVRWVGAVGDDPFGREIVRGLRGEGVDVSHVRVMPGHPTGVMVKEFRDGPEPHVHYYRGSSAARTLDVSAVSSEVVGGASYVHVTGITLAISDSARAAVHRLLKLCRDGGGRVSFDPNLRRKLRRPEDAVADWQEVFPFVDDLLLSEAEAELCVPGAAPEEAAKELAANGLRSVVVTLGHRGAVGIEDGDVCRVDARPVRLVDSVGGGDAFNAGFLHERLEGGDLDRCLAAGTWVASRVIAQFGDWEGLPLASDYDGWTRSREYVLR